MKLDETRVAIRERSWLEILDLALSVCAVYWRPICVTFFLGALPLAFANDVLISRLTDFDLEEEPAEEHIAFLCINVALVFMQAPLASVFTTSLLGRVMFLESPDLPSLLRQVWDMAPRWLFSQGLLRGSLLSLLAVAFLPVDNRALIFLVLTILGLYAGLLRCVWPFLNEVILLERPGKRDSISLSERMRKLHEVEPGDLFARFLASGLFATLVSLAIVQLLWFVSWVVDGGISWSSSMTRVGVPVALWITAAYFSVVRFLGYLDRRTRLEGWSVSLQLRAESQRLTKQV